MSTSSNSPRIPAIYGTSFFGTKVAATDAQAFIDTLLRAGGSRLDTAQRYGNGASENVVVGLDVKNCTVDTKIFPSPPDGFSTSATRDAVERSRALFAQHGLKINVLYLHAPDRETPIEETLEALNEAHKAGAFKELGLSNFYAWEVGEVVGYARAKGWVVPTVYQGQYNAIDRTVEEELFPCLRKYNIRFAAYSPLAGGILTTAYLSDPQKILANPRFQHPRWKDRYTVAIEKLAGIRALAESKGITIEEAATRWLVHHSALRTSDHGVLYGASKVEQLETSLANHAKDPLPEDIATALEDLWVNELKGKTPTYAM
ncbi:unnamed protein product [Peniophora sp. CBMAI 1063]|nr:unnamed protein product [Peniophora sp. CBMAI 1063]